MARLSAQHRPQAFYGAVIQAWLGNSCGDPSLSLSPTRVLNLNKCHQFVNVLLHCCWACSPVLDGMLVLLGFSQWSVL